MHENERFIHKYLLLFFHAQAFDNSDKTDQKRMYVKRLFSGGDHSFAFATPNSSESYDDRAVEYVAFLSISNSFTSEQNIGNEFSSIIDQIRR